MCYGLGEYHRKTHYNHPHLHKPHYSLMDAIPQSMSITSKHAYIHFIFLFIETTRRHRRHTLRDTLKVPDTNTSIFSSSGKILLLKYTPIKRRACIFVREECVVRVTVDICWSRRIIGEIENWDFSWWTSTCDNLIILWHITPSILYYCEVYTLRLVHHDSPILKEAVSHL